MDASDGIPEDDRQISITTTETKGNVEVWIRDNGRGRDAKELQKTYDSLYTTKS